MVQHCDAPSPLLEHRLSPAEDFCFLDFVWDMGKALSFTIEVEEEPWAQDLDPSIPLPRKLLQSHASYCQVPCISDVGNPGYSVFTVKECSKYVTRVTYDFLESVTQMAAVGIGACCMACYSSQTLSNG